MRYKTIKVFLYFLVIFLMGGCFYNWNSGSKKMMVYRPVYASASTDFTIRLVAARTIHKPGKIYTYGSLLLVNEQKEGIHIFDNNNPRAPKALGFLIIPNNTDMAIRNDVLYVNHYGSLTALDIADLDDIKQLTRIRAGTNDTPPQPGYYECVDAAKGEVIGWDLRMLDKPKCYL